MCQWTMYGFLGEKESEDRRHKMMWAVLVPRKEWSFPWIAKRAAKFIDQLGHTRVTLRCDNESAIEALARERLHKPAKTGGVCGVLEHVRHRQGRKDTTSKTTRAKGQHIDPGVWRKDPVHAGQASERRKVGAAIAPRSVRWYAELVVRGSGCHRAGTGDQDKVGEHQETPRVGEMGRWQHTPNAGHPLVPRWQ